LCHRRCLFARIAFDGLDYRAAHHAGVRELSDRSELLRSRNAEADGYWKFGVSSQARDEFPRIIGQLRARTSDSRT